MHCIVNLYTLLKDLWNNLYNKIHLAIYCSNFFQVPLTISSAEEKTMNHIFAQFKDQNVFSDVKFCGLFFFHLYFLSSSVINSSWIYCSILLSMSPSERLSILPLVFQSVCLYSLRLWFCPSLILSVRPSVVLSLRVWLRSSLR